jgi:CSLREA domain-containing protein
MLGSIGHNAAVRRLLTRLSALTLIAPLAVGVLGPVGPVHAATTITVTTTADELTNNGNCSLREAIRAANTNTRVDACPAGSPGAADTILVPAGTYNLNLQGRNEDAALAGDLDLVGAVTITGAAAGTSLIVGGGDDRVLDVLAGSTVQISNLTVTGGFLPCGSGGGIRNAGMLSLTNTTVSGNNIPLDAGPANPFPECTFRERREGGGIANSGTLTLIGATVSDNHLDPSSEPANSFAGGISSSGALTLINTTVSGNSAFLGGAISGNVVLSNSTVTNNVSDQVSGGILGAVTARNSIVAGNRLDFGNESRDCTEGTSQGFNLLGTCTLSGDLTGNIVVSVDNGINPFSVLKLGPLQNNGGLTPTHGLLPGSRAIDAGNPAAPGTTPTACSATDQRGVSRPQDGNLDGRAVCDIGAFEVQPPVRYASLCVLSRQFVTNKGMATGMCTVLNAAKLNETLGVPRGKEGELAAYRRLVDAALRAHFITVEHAATLTELSKRL